MICDFMKLGKYKHFKGNLYEVICLAKHTETGEEMVIYRDLSDSAKIWVRPAKMFNEKVNVNGVEKPRFEFIE